MSSDLKKLSTLLDELLDIDSSKRSARLDEIAQSDSALASKLRELLATRERMPDDALVELRGQAFRLKDAQNLIRDGTIDSATEWLSPAASPNREPGQRVGPYELVRELGRGGMGVVWLAKRADGQHERQVALKMPIIDEFAWHVTARFARERAILASLEHPGIARLYETGIDDSRQPYIAIEYVPGQTILEYVRAKALKPEATVRLFIKVLEAVSHAHAQLVIHRDIKPSNIIVDPKGESRLLDFGIAKLLDNEDAGTAEATQLTRVAGRALTLDYASPEQVNGIALGTASDIYTLGVVLFELLTGSRPYFPKDPTRRDLEQAILEQEPPRPSDHLLSTRRSTTKTATTSPITSADAHKASRQLRGDLDTIVLKALKKQPNERYLTAQAFADDLKRYLAYEPIQAKPDSGWYSFKKFVRRNRLVFVGSIALITSLTVGLVGTLWQAAEANISARDAQNAFARESAVQQLYIETLARIAAWDRKNFEKVGAISKALNENLAEFERRYANDDEVRLGLLEAVAVQLPFLGHHETSLSVAQRFHEAAVASKIDSSRQLRAMLAVERALSSLGRHDEAEQLVRTALATNRRTTQNLNNYTYALQALARNLSSTGRIMEARAIYEDALSMIDEVPDRGVRWLTKINYSRSFLGYDDQKALQVAQEAHDEYLGSPGANDAYLANSGMVLGTALHSTGKAAEAEAVFAKAETLAKKMYGEFDRDTTGSHASRAGAISAQGRYDEVKSDLTAYLPIIKTWKGSDAQESVARIKARLLENEVASGQPEFTPTYLFESVDDSQQLLATPEYAVFVRNHAKAMIAAGSTDLAFEKVSAWLEGLNSAKRETPIGFHMQLALIEIELAQNKYADTLTRSLQLREKMQQRGATRSWLYREALELEAVSHALLGHPERAQALLTETQRSDAATTPPSASDRIDSCIRHMRVFKNSSSSELVTSKCSTLAADLATQHPASHRRTFVERFR
jgi:eukaryotic-like serine/threonine-protein kinase